MKVTLSTILDTGTPTAKTFGSGLLASFWERQRRQPDWKHITSRVSRQLSDMRKGSEKVACSQRECCAHSLMQTLMFCIASVLSEKNVWILTVGLPFLKNKQIKEEWSCYPERVMVSNYWKSWYAYFSTFSVIISSIILSFITLDLGLSLEWRTVSRWASPFYRKWNSGRDLLGQHLVWKCSQVSQTLELTSSLQLSQGHLELHNYPASPKGKRLLQGFPRGMITTIKSPK